VSVAAAVEPDIDAGMSEQRWRIEWAQVVLRRYEPAVFIWSVSGPLHMPHHFHGWGEAVAYADRHAHWCCIWCTGNC
jgi:hypothetical protein